MPPPQPDTPEFGQTRGSGRTPAAILPRVLRSELRLEAIIQFRETTVPHTFFAQERSPLLWQPKRRNVQKWDKKPDSVKGR